MNRKQLLALFAAGACGTLMFPSAHAQAQDAFPQRPVKIVVGFPAGGSSDSAARVLAERLSADWGQPVIVENKPGAGATIAAAMVASAEPDGHTLLLIGPGTHAISAALYPKLPYAPLKSFTSVGQVAVAPFYVLVNGSSNIRTLRDLIEQARANPNKISYASSGSGAGPHLIAESLARAAGIKTLHVPYNGAAPATLALLSGLVDFAVADMSALPHIQSGRLRVLAVTTAKRSDQTPDAPTLAEAGVPGLEYTLTVGLIGPAGMSPALVQKINGAMNNALANEEARRKLTALGYQAAPTTPEGFAKIIASDLQKYTSIVQQIGLKRE
jgi:tripartite-type tricarboxylate transporter receptor subunit TctC